MMRRLILLVIFAPTLLAQTYGGRQIGFGGACDLLDHSSNILHGNPAVLAAPFESKWRLDLPHIAAGAANNAFDVGFWNDQIARDHYLSESDKQEILDRIPDDGLRVHGLASTMLIGGVYEKAALQASIESAVEATADRELFELALYGNEIGRPYRLDELGGEQYNLVDVGVAVGYKFEQEWIQGLYGGIGFHFYGGLNYEKITDATGELNVTDSLITGYGAIQRVHAERGDGVGFDLGGIAEINDQWSFGLALRQIGAAITWQLDYSTLEAFAVDSAGIIVDSLDDDDYLERVFEHSQDTLSGGGYESKLPTILESSGRYKLNEKFLFLGTLRARLQESAQGKAGVEVAAGGEYRPHRLIVLRGGAGVGGPLGFRLGTGVGLDTKHYLFDFGISWHGGVFKDVKGVTLGINHAIRF
ncbi:hypothetical protein IT157_03850 [bacterium]|nr:hypothetical protein [bacterium]